jgi:RNA polymerase sigma-70 factor, ECF subfamily
MPPGRSGDAAHRAALANEVLGYLEPLYATALRLTRQPADAEDLVHDTYVKALRFSDSFESGTNLRAWLYTILHNTWRNRLRDGARSRVDVDSDVVEREEARGVFGGSSQTPEQILLLETIDSDLQTALDELPELYRQAVWLRDVEEFTYAEIAKMLQIPMGTVMSRIARGRRLLYERLSAGGVPARRSRVAGEPA